tara:strand:- start:40 stop:1458 length:1419 start_codon:yes stop_codon:yes gene_type:complete
MATVTSLTLSLLFLSGHGTLHREGWRTEGPSAVSSDDLIHLVVAVAQSNTAELKQTLLDVSNATGPKFGHHLSNAQVNALVAPTVAARDAVYSWLAESGVTNAAPLTPNGDFVGATVSIGTASTLLNATFSLYVSTSSGETVVRPTEAYTLPESVAMHIDFVSPMASLPSHRPRVVRSAGLARSEITRVTPQFLRKLYSMTDADVGKGAASNNTQAIASFIEQYYAHSDNTAFWKKYGNAGVTTPFMDVPPTQKHTPVGTEAALDTQYIAALGAGISTEVWYTEGTQPGNVANEPFISFLTKLASTDAAPSLFSMSYGDEEDGVVKAYALRCNVEFMKAGARGISLLAAAGDSGAGCGTLASFSLPRPMRIRFIRFIRFNSIHRSFFIIFKTFVAAGRYVPTFPASSPWITAVGGLQGGAKGASSEVVWPSGGGGFSNYFPRPSYQDAAVKAYLAQSGLPKQVSFYFNRSYD